MEERLLRLEERIQELAESLGNVEERLGRLEELRAAGGFSAWDVPGARQEEADNESPGAAVDSVGVLALVGRTLLAVAGAYLLRALTSEGLLPQTAGVAAGLAYAALWIFLADRAGARRQAASAAMSGATAVLLAVPLIWETTVRFAFLTAPAAAAALAVLTALALAVAGRRSLRSVAWIATLGGGVSALALGGPTHAPAPFAFYLVLLGVATLELARVRGWIGLPWVTAALADLAVALLWGEDAVGEGTATLAGVLLIQLTLAVLYAASFGRRAWRSDDGVSLLAAVQTAAALAVGYGGAVALVRSSGSAEGPLVLGTASLVVAALLYGAAFLGLERERRRSSLYFTSLALVLVLAGSVLLFGRPAYVWVLLALTGAVLGSRLARLTLSLHAAVYALAAAVASGLLRSSVRSWTASPGDWQPLAADSWLALTAAAVCLAFPVTGNHTFWRRYRHLPKLVFLVLVVGAAGGLLVRASSLLPSGADPAVVATLRTAILALAALGLAALGRLEALREASILVYPVLVLGAVKLLIEDFPSGRPATLFIALAFYGGALILAPRMLRGRT